MKSENLIMPQTVFVGEYSDIVLEEDDNYASTNTRHSSR